jgi:hypothetical protein
MKYIYIKYILKRIAAISFDYNWEIIKKDEW